MSLRTPFGRPPRILINVPILNEIENIAKLVNGISTALQGQDYVLLIVDDGSTDGTLEYLEQLIPESCGRIRLLNHKKTRRGCQRGAALLAGLEWAVNKGGFDVFVEMDGDLSHRPEELPRGIEVIAGGTADIAIVSKYAEGSMITGRSPGRTVISLICNFAVRSAVRWSIRDFSNGYRFYNRVAAELIPKYFIRYGSPIYLTEVMAIWLRHRLRIVEMPGHYVGRNEGLSKVRPQDYAKAAMGVLDIAARFHFGGFRSSAEEAALPLASIPAAETAILEKRDG
jgi:dolichol-phosphate mannosyltransferase